MCCPVWSGPSICRALREVVAEELSLPLMGERVATQAEEVAQRMTELWMDLPTSGGAQPPPKEHAGTMTMSNFTW